MAEAQRQEAQSGPPEELPFSATIMCVGITGVGKTATIHSLLGIQAAPTAGFGPETKQVRKEYWQRSASSHPLFDG